MSHHLARELDRLGGGDTWVHRLDARAKLLGALVYCLCLASFPARSVADLVPFALLPALLLAAGAVPGRTLLRAQAGSLPFLVMVGMWNPILDRSPAAHIGPWTVSGGACSFASILLRGVFSVAMLTALVACTPVPALLAALRSWGAPRALVVQLFLLYRYLFVLGEEARRLGDARALRQPARRHPTLAVARQLLAALLARSLARGERIHRAMLARGFRGEFPLLSRPHLHATDLVFAGLAIGACIALRLLPATGFVGRMVLGAG